MNTFQGITDRADLARMVREGVECENCGGGGYVEVSNLEYGPSDDYGDPTSVQVHGEVPCGCNAGRTPIPNADLDVLAACWCEGWEQHVWTKQWDDVLNKTWHEHPPAYTTSPAAAMRLMLKYDIIPTWLKDNPQTVEELCYALTTAALLVVLEEEG